MIAVKPGDAVREYLDWRELDYATARRGHGLCTFWFRARGNTCGMLVKLTAADTQAALRVHVSGSARAYRTVLVEVQRLVRWANDGDPFGLFVIHGLGGDISYCVSAGLTTGETTPAAIDKIVETAAARYDRLYPSLTRITDYGGKAKDLIPVTETPTWESLMDSLREDLEGVVFERPQARMPGRALGVGHVQLFFGNLTQE